MRIEQIGGATLYLQDCREVLPGISAAALIGDPPYGMNVGNISGGSTQRFRRSRGLTTNYHVVGDDKPFDPSHLMRFEKIILWGANHYASRLPDARKWLVWDKRAGGTSDNQADCELAWTNLSGPERIHVQLWRGMVRSGEENVSKGFYRTHPTQKPIALMARCIKECLLRAGQTICDPYMGSGTTGVAASRAGHPFIGCEIDPEHFETACRRIEEAQRQTSFSFTTDGAHGS